MSQADDQFHFAVLTAGLQDRRLLSPFAPADRSWHVIYLRSGSLAFSGEDAGFSEAPAILCLPNAPGLQIRLSAGSAGAHLALNETAMSNILGNRPEAIDLRLLVNGPVALPLHTLPELQRFVAFTLEQIGAETQRQSPGKMLLIEAQLRGLLILLWREAFKPAETLTRDGPQTILLRQFRQLVETHFRKRWKIKDYANALNTTPDRLHNVTTTVLGRAPLELVHDRSQREARDLLRQSSLTLDQIAAHLGFASTPQFSAFFRKHERQPPGRYRSVSVTEARDAPLADSARFDDWP